jgi:hypothetical protein
MEQIKNRFFIPQEYLFAHEYCIFLHDILANIVVEGEKERIFDYQFELRDPDHAKQIASKSGDVLAKWMEQNGYEAEFHEANRRHICLALLSDFCHFIYEALECSQKGKLTVAFALLRKPLKENLFYFEWLLADPNDFVTRFHAPIEDSKRPLPLPTELTKNKRLEVIQKAIGETEFGSWVSPEFIYELRYDKNCLYGFECLFQRANHLITTFTGKTEEQNFNFVFSGEHEHLSQWKGLYTLLPMLLLHSLLVIESVIQGFGGNKLKELSLFDFRAKLGFLLYVQSNAWDTDFEQLLANAFDFMQNLELKCLGCQNTITVFHKKNLYDLYRDGIIECPTCSYKTLLTGNEELLILGHLAQGQIKCPNCDAVIVASEENLENCSAHRKVKCQQCNEEIELLSDEHN